MSLKDIASLGKLLAQFLGLFADCFRRPAGRSLLAVYVRGLLSDVQRKNVEAMALARGVAPRTLQRFLESIHPLFLVSAWSVECGISLGQLATEEKSNEITAIPALLENLDVKGAIVTIDAAGCQKNIAQQIIDGGGHYVLSLKGNQGNIHQDVAAYVMEQMADDFAQVTAQQLEVNEKGHGRHTTYWYTQLPVPETIRGQELWAKDRRINYCRADNPVRLENDGQDCPSCTCADS